MDLLSILINQAPTAALALAGLYLILTGKVHTDGEFTRLETENKELRQENQQLRDALMTERSVATESARSAQVTNQLISGLVTLASERRELPAPPLPRRQRRDAGLTGKDVGL